MLNRHTFLGAAACGALVLSLAGCASSPSSPPPPPSANLMRLSAQLTGGQEVPPNPRPGTGTADVTFDRGTNMLRWTVTYANLSGPLTGAHFHGPAGPTANAGVVVPIANAPSPITGQATITPAQAGDLLAGLWYVNLHTAAHPGGEIRGQLRLR